MLKECVDLIQKKEKNQDFMLLSDLASEIKSVNVCDSSSKV